MMSQEIILEIHVRVQNFSGSHPLRVFTKNGHWWRWSVGHWGHLSSLSSLSRLMLIVLWRRAWLLMLLRRVWLLILLGRVVLYGRFTASSEGIEKRLYVRLLAAHGFKEIKLMLIKNI